MSTPHKDSPYEVGSPERERIVERVEAQQAKLYGREPAGDHVDPTTRREVAGTARNRAALMGLAAAVVTATVAAVLGASVPVTLVVAACAAVGVGLVVTLLTFGAEDGAIDEATDRDDRGGVGPAT